MQYQIGVVSGDGIGPEIVRAAIKVLKIVAEKEGLVFSFTEVPIGGNAYDRFGTPLPQSSIETSLRLDSLLLGAVGGPKWESLPGDLRPEKGLLGIRKAMGLYANLRPTVLYPELKEACPLKAELLQNGIDFVIVRELTGGLYYGKRGKTETSAFDTMNYTTIEIKRVVKHAFEMARLRKKKICSVDKANVLECSRLWRECVEELALEYPDIQVTHMLVDNAAMQLIKNPGEFDVIVTENMFGDILSDEAAQLTGSIGMLPSGSLGKGSRGLYEPIHGSAPDLAGKNLANPLGAILSAAMMLWLSFQEKAAAERIRDAVKKTIASGVRTADIACGGEYVSTKQMTEAVIREIEKQE